jgi:hypothetical protein
MKCKSERRITARFVPPERAVRRFIGLAVDPTLANETLYQLSYTPEIFGRSPVKVQNLISISTGR